MKKLQRIKYNKENDAYEIWISTNDGDDWDFTVSYPCCGEGNQCVRYEFILNLQHNADLGYELIGY